MVYRSFPHGEREGSPGASRRLKSFPPPACGGLCRLKPAFLAPVRSYWNDPTGVVPGFIQAAEGLRVFPDSRP